MNTEIKNTIPYTVKKLKYLSRKIIKHALKTTKY